MIFDNNKKASTYRFSMQSQVEADNDLLKNEDLLKKRICPECNALLTSTYEVTKVTICWSVALTLGLACMFPCLLDACHKLTLRCETCDRTVLVTEPHCLCL